MVIDNKSMLEHVENPFLEEFARFLQPSYSHVTRRDVEEDCLTSYKKEKAQLKEKITKLTSKVSLSIASFDNPRDEDEVLSCVQAHFIDEDFKLFKTIIGFLEDKRIWGINKIDYDRVLNDWGLCNKVFAWSKDDHTRRAEKFSPTTLDVECILDCFQSIANDINFRIRSFSIIEMMDNLNKFPEKMCYFNEIAEQHNLARKFEFVLSNEGVLGFDLNILNEACTYKNVINALFDMNIEWSKLEEVVPLLNKINDVAVMLSSLEFPTSNLLLKYVFEISDVLSEASPVLSGGTKGAIDRSLKNLDEYLASCDCILLIASLLDPRFKLRFHKRFIGKFIEKEEDFVKSFCILYNKYQSESTEIYRFDRLSQIPELKKYLKGRVEEGDVNFDVLGWWKDNELVYPILSRMARDILAIPVSVSFTSEPMEDMTAEIFYLTVDPEMSKVLVCCNNWLRAGCSAGNSVAGLENIIERRRLDQAFSEHSKRSNSCVYDQIECEELLAKLVISCELPFHFVKSTWFIEWAKNLQPFYTPVDLASFKTKCLGFYQIERQMFKNLHEKTFVNSAHLERVCFSAHLVGEDPRYVCVTAHFIDNDFNLVRRTIGIKIITNWEDSAITAQIQRCIDNWELPKKVLAFTTPIIYDGLTWGAGTIKMHCINDGLLNELLKILWKDREIIMENWGVWQDLDSFIDEIQNPIYEAGMLEVKRYLQESLVDVRGDDFDVLRWWNDNKSNFPILSRIACHILAIPVSSLPSESASVNHFYSTYNDKIRWYGEQFMRFEKVVHQLGPRTLEALVMFGCGLNDEIKSLDLVIPPNMS
ncbi:zinc finger BED domain-containing protein RICESLEEPER 2-like [Carex rostrata]